MLGTALTLKVTWLDVTPLLTASTVTGPAAAPVTTSLVVPLATVGLASPVSEPLPEAWVKVTTLALSTVSMLANISSSVALSVHVDVDVMLAEQPLRTIWLIGPGPVGEMPSLVAVDKVPEEAVR